MGRETCHSREKVWTTNFARSYHVALAINNPEREREREREREKHYETRAKSGLLSVIVS